MPRKSGVTTALVRRRPAALSEWDGLVAMWLHGRPENTCEIYRPVIQSFRKFVDGIPIRAVTLAQLQAYADTLAAQKPRTVQRKLMTIKSLLSFATKTGMIPFNAGAALRVPRPPDDLAEKILPQGDIQRIIVAEEVPRNRVLIRLLYVTGIRASEAAGLRWIDCQERTEGGQISVLGKRNKRRSIKVAAGMWAALLELRPQKYELKDRVFQTVSGRAMSRDHITHVVERAARKAGIEQHVSAHWMRHGHATHAMDRGAPLALISQSLGHSSLATTSRYLHARPESSSSEYIAQ